MQRHRARPLRGRAGCAALLAALLLPGCATRPPGPESVADMRAIRAAGPDGPIELAGVPFFAQEQHQCGPAALATLLGHSGADVSAEQLGAEIYLPGREGTLSPELVAAVRRHGRLPERLPARFDAVLGALARGHPVLVLQNLGLSWWPLWHYAVVYGYDPRRAEVLLRSGTQARQIMPRFTFEHTWARSGHFAIIALGAEQPPLFTAPADWLQTLASTRAPLAAWQTATQTWPDQAAGWFGLGYARYQTQPPDLAGAALAWQEAIQRDPDLTAAYNNLAQVLGQQHEPAAALEWIDTGLRHARNDAARQTLLQTRAEILAERDR